MAGNKNSGQKRKLTPLEELDLYTMYKQGGSILDIQIKFRVSESTVKRTVKRIEQRLNND